MAPIPWNQKPEYLSKLREFIILNNLNKFDNTEMDRIGSHLGLNINKIKNGVFVHRTILRSFYLTARNYIISINAEITAPNIGDYIVYKKINYDTDQSNLAKTSFTLIEQNIYLTKKPFIVDCAETCSCLAEVRCGPRSNCVNR